MRRSGKRVPEKEPRRQHKYANLFLFCGISTAYIPHLTIIHVWFLYQSVFSLVFHLSAYEQLDIMSTFLHSYYPLGINIPGYLPNESSVSSLIGQFALLWAAIVGIAWLTISRSRPDASNADHLAFVWFCFSMFPLYFERNISYKLSSCFDPSLFRRLFRG